jgi:ubiquinone/menaquinone biosynthesis C-methylase UbiE
MEAVTRSLLERWDGNQPGLSILDASRGTGQAMVSCLAEYGQVTGCDISSSAFGSSP